MFRYVTNRARAYRLILCASVFLAAAVNAGQADAQGGGVPIVDAHSQADCTVSLETVLGQLNRLKIRHVQISARGCKGWDSAKIEARNLTWAKAHPDRISILLSTKLDGWSDADLPQKGIDKFIRRSGKDGFGGMGEILVQHAAHKTEHLTYPALSLSLGERRIAVAIGLARSRRWPVILHVELNDSEGGSQKTLGDFEALLARFPDTQFGLIHMGQASPGEARRLLGNHRNIFFLTSSADDFTAFVMNKARQQGARAQTGWINLFEGRCALRDCPSAWKPAWRELVTAYPARFVLAFDNVFPNHWGKPYNIKVKNWRRALSLLPRNVAVQVSCANAVRLWSLKTRCN